MRPWLLTLLLFSGCGSCSRASQFVQLHTAPLTFVDGREADVLVASIARYTFEYLRMQAPSEVWEAIRRARYHVNLRTWSEVACQPGAAACIWPLKKLIEVPYPREICLASVWEFAHELGHAVRFEVGAKVDRDHLDVYFWNLVDAARTEATKIVCQKGGDY